MKKSKRAGFTLVEVLTVIAIIALLAGLILGLASNAQRTAGRKRAESEVTQLQSFVTDYQMKYGQVPKDKALLKTALEAESHPLAELLDPWGTEYLYERPAGSRTTFYLWSTGGEIGDEADHNRSAYIGNPMPE
jgi:prepilin-type N-terminal cleavage/methylation domain-containing protein